MRAYERLLNYVRVHTTSDETSGTHPSAEREFDLARQLVEEMKALGMEDAHVDEHCYVYGTLPATPGCEDKHALGLRTPPMMPAARTCSPSSGRTTTAAM